MKYIKENYYFLFQPFILFILTGSVSVIFGQSPKTAPTPDCPKIMVSSAVTVTAGSPLTFTALVNGGDPNTTPTYNWSISAGTIESGQGTSTITLETTRLGDQSVTATVDIGGYLPQCRASNSSTTSVTKKAEAQKIDEYGKVNSGDQKARLDNFAIYLSNDPTATAYIIIYNGRKSISTEAQKNIAVVKNYLFKMRGVDPARVNLSVGGYREETATELWIVSAGADLPKATPTIDPSEIKTNKSKKAVKSTKTKSKKS